MENSSARTQQHVEDFGEFIAFAPETFPAVEGTQETDGAGVAVRFEHVGEFYDTVPDGSDICSGISEENNLHNSLCYQYLWG